LIKIAEISANCKTGDYRYNGKPWMKFLGKSKSSERDFDIKILYADKPYIATLEDGQNVYYSNLSLFSQVCSGRTSQSNGKDEQQILKRNQEIQNTLKFDRK
jgi:hypothetical protein